jgi:hypothetical protein
VKQSTAQQSTAQQSTAQQSTAQHGTVKHNQNNQIEQEGLSGFAALSGLIVDS